MREHGDSVRVGASKGTRKLAVERFPDPGHGAPDARGAVPMASVLSGCVASPAALLTLQRMSGNRAVTQLLRPHLAGPVAWPRATSNVVQRDPDTEKLMKKLAVPLTFQLEGEQIAIQDALAAALDKEMETDTVQGPVAMDKLGKKEDQLRAELAKDARDTEEIEAVRRDRNKIRANLATYNDATYIGAIILTEKVGEVGDLMSTARLLDLPSLNDKGAKLKQSLVGGAYHLVRKAGLEQLVIANTLITMEKAAQLEYFRKAGLPNDKFAVVIEVHYYRNRPTSSTKLHKDTAGQTLFVNLSFTNKKKVLGPEYIINPASNAIYDQFVKQKLPQVFVDDLNAVKGTLPGQGVIHATVLEQNGVVAFVDEAIHHKTPTPGPRTVTVEGLRKALQETYAAEYDDADTALKAFGKSWGAWSLASYFKNPTAKAHATDWQRLFEMLDKFGPTQGLKRAQVGEVLTGYFSQRLDADEVIEQAATDFTSVSYGHLGTFGGLEAGKRLVVPVKRRGDKPLTRTMSVKDLSEFKATAAEGGKRSFFRTWVRAVPRADVVG